MHSHHHTTKDPQKIINEVKKALEEQEGCQVSVSLFLLPLLYNLWRLIFMRSSYSMRHPGLQANDNK